VKILDRDDYISIFGFVTYKKIRLYDNDPYNRKALDKMKDIVPNIDSEYALGDYIRKNYLTDPYGDDNAQDEYKYYGQGHLGGYKLNSDKQITTLYESKKFDSNGDTGASITIRSDNVAYVNGVSYNLDPDAAVFTYWSDLLVDIDPDTGQWDTWPQHRTTDADGMSDYDYRNPDEYGISSVDSINIKKTRTAVRGEAIIKKSENQNSQKVVALLIPYEAIDFGENDVYAVINSISGLSYSGTMEPYRRFYGLFAEPPLLDGVEYFDSLDDRKDEDIYIWDEDINQAKIQLWKLTKNKYDQIVDGKWFDESDIVENSDPALKKYVMLTGESELTKGPTEGNPNRGWNWNTDMVTVGYEKDGVTKIQKKNRVVTTVNGTKTKAGWIYITDLKNFYSEYNTITDDDKVNHHQIPFEPNKVVVFKATKGVTSPYAYKLSSVDEILDGSAIYMYDTKNNTNYNAQATFIIWYEL